MPEEKKQTLMECADSLEKISTIFQDIGVVIAETYPGLSAVVGNYNEQLRGEASFIRAQ
jgi:hypothetical protein